MHETKGICNSRSEYEVGILGGIIIQTAAQYVMDGYIIWAFRICGCILRPWILLVDVSYGMLKLPCLWL